MSSLVWLPTLLYVVGVAPNTTPDTAGQLQTLLHALIPLWPLWLLVAVAGAGKVAVEMWEMRRLRRAGMFEIDRMTGPMFEQRLALLFRSLGYEAAVLGSTSGDYGGDLLLKRDRRTTVVQAKCWSKRNVGVRAVQEAVGARGYYKSDSAMVVTNSRFTEQARNLAGKNDVELWDRDRLIQALLKAENKQEATRTPVTSPSTGANHVATLTPALAVAATAQATVAGGSGFCARCGQPVSEKVREYCLVHPEWFDGLVYCFNDQRSFKKRRRD